jgi:hypothetical protein
VPKPPLKIRYFPPALKPTFWTTARMGGNDRDVPSLSNCGVLGARQVLRQEIGRTCDGHDGVPRLYLRGTFRVAAHSGVGRFVNAAASLAVYPSESCGSTQFVEGDFWTGIPSECPVGFKPPYPTLRVAHTWSSMYASETV